MVRKDPVQDLDRPHYYSQFWLDVASGKRDLAAVRQVEADAELEPEFEDIEPAPPPIELPKPAARARPAKPEKKLEPARPTITSLADLANIDMLMKNSAAMEGDEVPDLEAGAMGDLEPFASDVSEPEAATTFDLDEPELEPELLAEDENEEGLGELEYDEDEEEDEWGAPRKSSKPSKQQRRRERDRGRGF